MEKYQPKHLFDVVISRAFTEVGNYLQLAGHLCKPNGHVLAMKGPRVESEDNVAKTGFELSKEIDIQVPFLDATRRLLIFNKT